MFGQKRSFYEHIVGMTPIALAAIGSILLLIGPSIIFLIPVIAGIGFIIHAKWRSLASGNLITYGTKHMTPIEKRNYYIGYGILAISVLASLTLLPF